MPENIFLGRELRTGRPGLVPELDHVRMRECTIDLLARFGVYLPRLDDPVVKLSGGQYQTSAISQLLLFRISRTPAKPPTPES